MTDHYQPPTDQEAQAAALAAQASATAWLAGDTDLAADMLLDQHKLAVIVGLLELIEQLHLFWADLTELPGDQAQELWRVFVTAIEEARAR